MSTSLLWYAVRKVAACLNEDQRGAFVTSALDDPIGALRQAAEEVPAEVAQLAHRTADDETRRQIARRIRMRHDREEQAVTFPW